MLLVAGQLAVGGCSIEHIENPRHSWFPMTVAAYDVADAAERSKSGDILVSGGASLAMVVTFVLDAAFLPFHALGHLFARRPPPPPAPEAGRP
jgi:hypothetical protein